MLRDHPSIGLLMGPGFAVLAAVLVAVRGFDTVTLVLAGALVFVAAIGMNLWGYMVPAGHKPRFRF